MIVLLTFIIQDINNKIGYLFIFPDNKFYYI
jgi:hypothetical protein